MAAAEQSPKAILATVLARTSLTDRNGTARSLSGKKIIMFYFSGHFCPPCRAFTPLLSKFYKRHAASKQLEVVFVSNDKDEAEFNTYFASMPWAAPSHRAMPMLASALQAAYGLISAIPTLLVVDADNLELLTSGGCAWVRKDASAAAFPWRGQSSPPPDFGSSNALLPMMTVAMIGVAAIRLYNWYRQRNY